MSNPHGYEAGFTIEQHRDELLERLGLAIRTINALNNVIDAFTKALAENGMNEFANRVRAAQAAAKEPLA